MRRARYAYAYALALTLSLLVAGTIWFVVRSGTHETRPAAPAVSVTPSGATFGWAGVF